MSLKLKDEDSTKRMKDMQEELKDPSLGEFSDLEQDPYVIESKRTTPIDKPVYQPDGKLSSAIDRNPYILSEEKQARIFGEDLGDKEIRKKSVRKEVMIVMFVGLALLFAGLAAYVHNDLFLRKAETVPGIVTEKRMHRNHATCTIFVDYEVDGKTYTKNVTATVNQYKNEINLDEIQIGDYVNYTYDIDSASSSYTLESKYSGYSSNQTIAQTAGLKWQVLNVDKENDTVDIISTNLTSSKVDFYGILGYNNGPYLMNEICKAQYSNKALGTEARSINLLDMEKQLTPTGITNRNAYTNAVKYGTTKTYTGRCSYYPKLYANQKGSGINTTSIIQPDITKGNDPYNESKAIASTEPTTDSSYGQATSRGLTVTQTFYSIAIDNTNYGTASSVLANSNCYWVAARSVDAYEAYSNDVSFRLRCAYTEIGGGLMFDSDTDQRGSGVPLRPVVSLPSSLLTGEQTNGAWNLR